MGQAPPSSLTNSEANGFPLIAGAGDFTDTGIRAKKYTELSSRISQVGDLILSIRATIGPFRIADQEYALGRGVAGLRPLPQVDAKFFEHAIRSLTPELQLRGRGATFLQVNRSDIAELQLPLPPLDEQRRIAEILDGVSKISDLALSQVDRLDSCISTLARNLIKEDSREMPGKEVFHSFRNGVSPSTGGSEPAEVLTLSAITKGAFDSTERKFGTFSSTPAEDKRVSSEDLLICRGNGNLDLVGRGVNPNKSFPNLVFPDTVIAGKVNTDVVEPNLLEIIWNLPEVRIEIEAIARSTSGIYKVNQNALSRLIPDKAAQEKFSATLSPISQTRDSLIRKMALLKELHHSLSTRAFQGLL